jgi:hypothetical protein
MHELLHLMEVSGQLQAPTTLSTGKSLWYKLDAVVRRKLLAPTWD